MKQKYLDTIIITATSEQRCMIRIRVYILKRRKSTAAWEGQIPLTRQVETRSYYRYQVICDFGVMCINFSAKSGHEINQNSYPAVARISKS